MSNKCELQLLVRLRKNVIETFIQVQTLHIFFFLYKKFYLFLTRIINKYDKEYLHV